MINTFEQLLESCKEKAIWQVAEGNEPEIRPCAKVTLDAMKEAIITGLKSEEMSMSGMCGNDSNKLAARYKNKDSLFGKLQNMRLQQVKKISEWVKLLPVLQQAHAVLYRLL